MARPPAQRPTLPAALTQEAVATLCREGALLWAEQTAGAPTVDCAAVTVADGAGVAFLWALQARARAHGITLTLEHLLPELSA
ncbi:MAG: lipid asymmetry maintenance protein MlaB, partial [Candidatus Spyradenecus sp.]